MFLSNPYKSFLLAGFIALFFQGCGSSQGNENRPVAINVEKKSEFPFSTKEPEVYQVDFVVANDNHEEKWFIARKGQNWKLDIFQDDTQTFTEMSTDKLYAINHGQKIYAVMSENGTTEMNPLVSDIKSNFFWGKDCREFEQLGNEGNLIKYRVRIPDASKGEVLIYIDPASGFIVRQEFSDRKTEVDSGKNIPFRYEIRNLKLEVDDSVFTIPEGYQKVTKNEYYARRTADYERRRAQNRNNQ